MGKYRKVPTAETTKPEMVDEQKRDLATRCIHPCTVGAQFLLSSAHIDHRKFAADVRSFLRKPVDAAVTHERTRHAWGFHTEAKRRRW